MHALDLPSAGVDAAGQLSHSRPRDDQRLIEAARAIAFAEWLR
jgi:hypothetical protein